MWKVKIEKHSISHHKIELVTFNLRIPRIILPELTRHRAFSFNVGSSRAIPTRKIIKQVEDKPFIPEFWGKNRRGMSASENIDETTEQEAKVIYLNALDKSIECAKELEKLNLHKQVINRILEPYMWIPVIITATDWNNFFSLRCDENTAEPHICKLARLMKFEMQKSEPQYLDKEQWHLPFVHELEIENHTIDECKKMSVARVARCSYNNHDGTEPNIEKDVNLHDNLLENKHFSCFEHQAKPFYDENDHKYFGNFCCWWQYRKSIFNESGELCNPNIPNIKLCDI